MLISIKRLPSGNNFSKNYENFWIESLKVDHSNCVQT